ncbi:MAG: hypothetical protein LBP39_03870, partial [Rickettsiales bacterium]|nr:hypothetical protein [Rickettsiales bacterium]
VNNKGFVYEDVLNYLYNKIYRISIDKHINVNRILSKMDIISLIMSYDDVKNIIYGWKYKLLGSILSELHNYPLHHRISFSRAKI